MTRLVPLTYREIIQRLRAAGFEFDRQAKVYAVMPEGFNRASRVTTGNSSLLDGWIPA